MERFFSPNRAAAQKFIDQHLRSYGLNGSEIRSKAVSAPLGYQEFTLNNHFQFGYNAQALNKRNSYSCVYWTNYSAPRRPPQTLAREIGSALTTIYELHGPFSLPFTGSLFSYVLIEFTKKMGLPLDVVILSIDNQNEFLAKKCPAPFREWVVKKEEFEQFTWDFCEATICNDPLIAFYALLGRKSSDYHIYDGGHIRLLNTHFDIYNNQTFGPPNWFLVDNEKFTAINRYLLIKNIPGCPNFFRYTAELFSSYFLYPMMRSWLHSTLSGQRAHNDPNMRNDVHIQINIFRDLGVPLPPNEELFYSPLSTHPQLTDNLRQDLRRCFPRADDQSLISLPKLFNKLDLAADDPPLIRPQEHLNAP